MILGIMKMGILLGEAIEFNTYAKFMTSFKVSVKTSTSAVSL